ncbi:MAG: hypothetical protein IT443_10060 [Phycisphaeraceae bacterium]|nr:hypothetical protein [Phycisphaeraceae bacterium]
MKKKLTRVAIGVGVGLVVVLVFAFLALNQVVKVAVEKGATSALGVPTTLGSADISVIGGSGKIKQLQVNNPEGFKSPYFFNLGEAEAAVALGSLMKDTVELPLLALADVTVNLESREGKSNYKVILENLGRYEGQEGAEKPAPAEGQEAGGKKFIVRELVIRNVKVDVDLLPAGGELTHQQIVIPEIRLTDIGTDSNKGVVMAELTGVITKAILRSVVDKGLQLPGAMLKELAGGLDSLKSVGDYGVKVVGDVTSKATEVVGEAGKKVEEAGKEVGKAVENVGKGLGGLLGGKKDEEKK